MVATGKLRRLGRPTPSSHTPSEPPSLDRSHLSRKCVKVSPPPSLPADLIDVLPLTSYPGRRRGHVLGVTTSRHSGAGLAVFAMVPLNARAGRWENSILCEYVGKRITFTEATADSYRSAYIMGLWLGKV